MVGDPIRLTDWRVPSEAIDRLNRVGPNIDADREDDGLEPGAQTAQDRQGN
jgi:hypothetical protein